MSQVRDHRIIYDLIDDVTRSLVAHLPPVEEIEELASADVLQVFDMKGKGTIAGCAVEGGTFVADQLVQVRILSLPGCLPPRLSSRLPVGLSSCCVRRHTPVRALAAPRSVFLARWGGESCFRSMLALPQCRTILMQQVWRTGIS